MKTKNILSLIILLTILCGFNSCMDKPIDTAYDPEYYLCNGRGWIDTYFDEYDNECDQRLIFYSGGTGRETIIRYLSDFPGDYEELTSNFRWYWDDDYRESLYIEFPNGDFYNFNDLYISSYELSGFLNGSEVTFEPF